MIELWQVASHNAWPLAKLLLGLCAGLFFATLLEATDWPGRLARFAAPLAKTAHLGSRSAAAFALAFASPYAANALLSEGYESGQLSFRELALANIFNGLPAWLIHLPTLFFLAWPVLGFSALTLAGLTMAAALLRAATATAIGRIILKHPDETGQPEAPPKPRLGNIFRTILSRFKSRGLRLLFYTAPIYLAMVFCQKAGYFKQAEIWLARQPAWPGFIDPQAVGIILTQMLAETGGALGAAQAALQSGAVSGKDTIVALLCGSVLAAPCRAIRHQLPAYAGYYKLGPALKLVFLNQGARAASMAAVIAPYACL